MVDSNQPEVELRPFHDARVLWPPDMPDDMLEDAVETAKDAMKKFDIESKGQEVAKMIKQHFDEKWDLYWHVTIGKSFGCHATHEARRFVYFYLDKYAFMMYKIGY